MLRGHTHAFRDRLSKKEKARELTLSGFSGYGLAVTYFRVRMHTIIGANPFHGPVRDGKAWFQVAMAARLTLGSPLRRDYFVRLGASLDSV
jgi:hypothetical protein